MKKCPKCGQTFSDGYNFCLDDGTVLQSMASDFHDAPTEVIPAGLITKPEKRVRSLLVYLLIGCFATALIAGGVFFYFSRPEPAQTNSSYPIVTVDSPRDGFLALKTEPCVAPCGKTLFKIPHGTRLALGTCNQNYEIADRKRGRCCYVTFQNQTGWIFDGFVTY